MRLAVAEEKSKEMERGRLMENSEFDKEKALLGNRIEYLEKSLEEVKKKENDVSDDVKNVRKEKE
jgi:molecular chaperone GrpE (heat shock protein)